MKSEMIKPSCRRMRDGWAPALEYDNGGVVIAAMRCGTMSQAISEAYEMLGCMSDYPDAFTHNHPAPNQMIDLSNVYDCSASLKWKQSGTEWQAEVHPEFQYVAMEIEGAWHAFLFLGSKYKRGHTIATDFETTDEAKQKCQEHYESLLPQNV